MESLTAFLKSQEYLKNVPDNIVQEIIRSVQRIELSPDEVLFNEGDLGDALYIVLEGTLSIEHEGVQLVTRGPGELVGEFALIDQHARSATVVAQGPVKLLKWTRDDFNDALGKNLDLVRGILSTITEKLRQSTAAQAGVLQMDEAGSLESLALLGNDWAPALTVVYQSSAMHQIFDQVHRIRIGKSSVLITGESGTGKELVARALHAKSPNKKGTFVALNCGALPESLAESELFGHESGSFTGADKDRRGKIEIANGGTLFLDEIGELPPTLQVKLLRVLDDGRVLRIGGDKPKEVKFRLVAATNRNLPQEIEEGNFREDLYYRLAVIGIHIPPLRERRSDIPPLVAQFAQEICSEIKIEKTFPPEIVDYMAQQHWRGNVRELRNAVERAIMVSRGKVIGPEDVRGVGMPPVMGQESAGGLPQRSSLEDLLGGEGDIGEENLLLKVENTILELAMEKANGNMAEVARQLGLKQKQVSRRIKKHPKYEYFKERYGLKGDSDED